MRSFVVSGPAGSTTFNGGAADASGVWWGAPSGQPEGWDSPDVKQALVDRMGAPGQIVQQAEPLARMLVVKNGLAIAPTEAARVAARDSFEAVLLSIAQIETEGLLTVTDPTASGPLVRTAAVYLAQRPVLVDLEPGVYAIGGATAGFGWPFSINFALLAPDPLRYAQNPQSLTILSGAAALISPGGNAPTPPSFALSSITGGDVYITAGPQVIHLQGSFPAALTVNALDRSVVDGAGANRYDLVVSNPDQWFDLDPSGTTVGMTAARAIVSWTAAWR